MVQYQLKRNIIMIFKFATFIFVFLTLADKCFADPDPRMDTKKIPDSTRFKGSVAEKLLGTKYPPCCSDLIGSVTCKRLKSNNLQNFVNRCDSDPDFSLIQCCNACGLTQAPERHQKFFLEGEKSKHCFDRHESIFCQKFLEHSDVWSPTQWSCSGEMAHLAFRICRKTCQFCNPNIYNGPDGGKWKPTPCGSIPEIAHIITK